MNVEARPELNDQVVKTSIQRLYPGGSSPILFDPMLCRVLPNWTRVLSTLADTVATVVVVEDLDLLASRAGRGRRRSVLYDLLLWTRYGLDAEFHSRDCPRGVVSASMLRNNQQAALDVLKGQLPALADLLANVLPRVDTPSHCEPTKGAQANILEWTERSPFLSASSQLLLDWAEKGGADTITSQRFDELRRTLDRISVRGDALAYRHTAGDLSDEEFEERLTGLVNADADRFENPWQGLGSFPSARSQSEGRSRTPPSSGVTVERYGEVLKMLRSAQDKLAETERELRETRNKYRAAQAASSRVNAVKHGNLHASGKTTLPGKALSTGLGDRLRATVLNVFARVWQKSGDRRAIRKLVLNSGLFEEDWYRSRYPDVDAAGVEPLTHFLKYGWQEGRDPGPHFSVQSYLRDYNDVASAGINPLVHFLEHGLQEGRGAAISRTSTPQIVDPAILPDAAPVFAPAQRHSAKPVRWSRELPDLDFDALKARFLKDEVSGGALWLFEQLILSEQGFDHAAPWSGSLGYISAKDIWFSADLMLRLRNSGAERRVLAAYQNMGSRGQIVRLRTEVGVAGDLSDIYLQSAFHPILLVCETAGQGPLLEIVTFPSLLRGGAHYAEAVSIEADPGEEGIAVSAYSASLAKSVIDARRIGRPRMVSKLVADIRDGTGTGQLFSPDFRAWLADVFDITISPGPHRDNPGENYLNSQIALGGTPRPGGVAEFKADFLPCISLLAGSVAGVDSGLMMIGQIIGTSDIGAPMISLAIPPIAPLALDAAACDFFALQGTLTGLSKEDVPGPVTGFLRRTDRNISDSERLFPLASPVPLCTFRPQSVAVVLDCIDAQAEDIEATILSLSKQDCAHSFEVVLCRCADPLAVLRGADIFPGRVSEAIDVEAFLAHATAAYVCALTAGSILHDWRTISVLATLVDGGADSASCILVNSSQLGKGWAVKVAANGLINAGKPNAFEDTMILTSDSVWRMTYPVLNPLPDLWLAAIDTVRNWRTVSETTSFDPVRHWCTGMVSASIGRLSNDRPPLFSIPPADRRFVASARIVKG
ncbi:MAG: hypothetical protein ACKOQ8_04955 [Micrococcales bacterium]